MKSMMILIALLTLSGCKTPAQVEHDVSTKEPQQFVISTGGDGVYIYTDVIYGCQYLNKGGPSLTPRLNPNGTQVCKVIK